MSRKHKHRKTRRKRQPPHSSFLSMGLQYKELPSPFDGSSEAQVLERVKSTGEEFARVFRESFDDLQKRILNVEPLVLLSSLSYQMLIIQAQRRHSSSEKLPIQQHGLELLQALLLRHRRDDFELKPSIAFDSSKFIDLIEKSAQAFQMRKLAQLDSSLTINQRLRLRALEFMRVHTQAVRNWGYPDQITQIVKKLFEPLDEDMENRFGVRASHLIDMGLNLTAAVARNLNQHRTLLGPVARAKSIRSAVDKYYQSFSSFQGSPKQLIDLAKERNATLPQLKQWLLSHSYLSLPPLFTFSLTDLVENYPVSIDGETLQGALGKWTLKFGDLHDQVAEHLFLGNPVWERPIIQLDDKTFFWPIPGLFISFCLELMETMIRPDQELYSKYERRRSKFLEDEIDRIFKSAFSRGKPYRGSQWHDAVSGKTFENDLLLVIDSYVVVVEAKSAKVTKPARRGADASLQDAIQKLIIEPTVQARRFSQYLLANRRLHRFHTRCGEVNEVDTSNVREVICLSVTLDTLGATASRWPDLHDAGFTANETELSPTMSLADLETVFEILDGTCEKLHYLLRRAQFEKSATYIGDELDLLAFYIDTGFNIGEEEFNGRPLILWGMSKLFDPYFMRDHWHENASRPRRRLTQWWTDILSRIEEKQVPRWTELGSILLNLGYDGQVAFEKRFQRLQKPFQNDPQIAGHGDAISIMIGPSQRRDAIVGFAYKHLTGDERNLWIKNVARDPIQNTTTGRALVIGTEVNQRDYPYSVIVGVIKSDG